MMQHQQQQHWHASRQADKQLSELMKRSHHVSFLDFIIKPLACLLVCLHAPTNNNNNNNNTNKPIDCSLMKN